MDQEIAFGKALQQLRREARENGGRTTSERVREVFREFSLDEKQFQDVLIYLRESHIGVDEEAPDAEEYLSDEEKDYLADYLKTVADLPDLTDREKERLYERAIEADADAQKRVAESFLKNVADIARLYVQQGVLIEDLIGEGNVALYHTVNLLGALEEASEVEQTLAHAVMDAMESYIADNLQEDARGQRAVNRVNEVADRAKELADDLRRAVTAEELMGETGWKRDKIVEAWRLSGGNIESLENPLRSDETAQKT
ncbi:MAG: hypothetical protein IK096_03650, partial [Lachnospiraceae bacterium]|nr:hypothetical protein [Lachnospiraceae bacterium]